MSRFFLFLSALLLLPLPLQAADPKHPVVAGFERFYTSDKADLARGGRLLLNELNCVSCHDQANAKERKQAPILTKVGDRVRVSYLKKYLADPHATKPGTTMPNVLAGDKDKDAKVEALIHYLASTGTLNHERPSIKSINNGRTLYSQVGCVGCHGSRDAKGKAAKVVSSSVPLGALEAKYTLPGLASFLADPLHTRPSGRMPRILKGNEAKDVAAFLLQGLKVPLVGKGTANYAYYETGDFDKLPDFSKLKPVVTGKSPGFDISLARRNSNFSMKFDAVLEIPRDAQYTFTLSSDDGSQLFIDGKRIVDNDGIHPTTTKTGKAKLTKGIHKITVTFFQGGGEAVLQAFIQGPSLGRRNLSEIVAATEADLKKKPVVKEKDGDTLEPKADLVTKGKAFFVSLGCASCHQMQDKGKPLASTLKSPELSKLSAAKGCLADKPGKGVWFSLGATQQKALTAALKAKAPAKTNKTAIADTMAAFNCYACHVRDKVGGPLEELNTLFLTTMKEMGDEGRLPPPLDGVGAKIVPEYFKNLLDKGVHDRPYMHTRMPGFGQDNVGHLIPAYAAEDKLPAIGAVKFKESTARVKATGRHLTGGLVFGCVKCHTFAGQKAEGVQGIDMMVMPKKLKRDWFHAYVTDPQRIRPGTRMPAGFVEGKSVYPKILDGSPLLQVEAMWLYLTDPKPQPPLGLGKKFIPLEPKDTAIIYRNFIQGAGARGIGVGFPEKVNLAFDANELRLAMIWQGAFIDAAKHWTDRGVGFQGPLGDNVVSLPKGPTFAVLEKSETPWPTKAPRSMGYRFKGYRLTKDDRPTFLYTYDDVTIEDFPNGVMVNKEANIKRTFALKSAKPPANLYYRAAVGKKIESLAGGWYKIDGEYKVKLDGSAKVRKAANGMELLVPVAFKDGKASIVQEYSW